jgi:hypothetical protein
VSAVVTVSHVDVGVDVSRVGDEPELSKHPERVETGPALGDLPVLDTGDDDTLAAGRPPCSLRGRVSLRST